MDEDSGFIEFARELRKDLTKYVELRLEQGKLAVYEKASKIAGITLSVSLLIIAGFFGFFFLSFAMGYWINHLTGSNFLGFMIITLVYLFLFIFILIFRKKLIEEKLANKIAGILMEVHTEKKESDEK